ncbi:MAG: hypothetical protein EPO08_06130 [Rhodospirillaceae bacterium]|nr:MAG: hypothetical protein EPO08_06130 [Rhodospirillaceae bacterium]
MKHKRRRTKKNNLNLETHDAGDLEKPPFIQVPDDWWGFAPKFPPGVSDGQLEGVLLRDGRMVAMLTSGTSHRPMQLQSEWVDVLNGTTIADSASDPSLLNEKIGTLYKRMRVVATQFYREVTIGDGLVIQTHRDDFCDWPLSAFLAIDGRAGPPSTYRLLKNFDHDQEFHLVNTSLCPQYEHGPNHVNGRYRSLDAKILFLAPNNTFIAMLANGDDGKGYYLARFRSNLTSPFIDKQPDLALVDASETLRAEVQSPDTTPEGRMLGIENLFLKARAASH